jgi:hypothetical protein
MPVRNPRTALNPGERSMKVLMSRKPKHGPKPVERSLADSRRCEIA